MALGGAMALHSGELRADLQQFYDIDLDHAAAGGHSARHVAALFLYLPRESRLRRIYDESATWSVEAVLQAMTFNALCAVFGGEDAPRIDPPGIKLDDGRTVSGLELDPSELMEILQRPRIPTKNEGVNDGGQS